MARQRQSRGKTLCLIALALACAASSIDSQEHQGKDPIIVEVHRVQDKVVYKLIPTPAPEKDILWGLIDLAKQRGADYPVVALVDDSSLISDIDAVPFIAAKAGFRNIRTYIVWRKVGRMAEIKLCPALPVSTRPPMESTCELAR